MGGGVLYLFYCWFTGIDVQNKYFLSHKTGMPAEKDQNTSSIHSVLDEILEIKDIEIWHYSAI